MKKYLVGCLMLSVFMLVLTGVPLQLVNVDSSKSAYAMGLFGRHHHGGGETNGSDENNGSGGSNSSGGTYSGSSHSSGDNGVNCNGHTVPEPATLSLLGAGIAGVGIYSFIRRRNRK